MFDVANVKTTIVIVIYISGVNNIFLLFINV